MSKNEEFFLGTRICEKILLMKKKKLLKRLLSGSKNIRFTEVVACAESFGFQLKHVSGSHHIYTHPSISELLNLQNVKGKAKPYQIKQLLQLIEHYNLTMEDSL